VVVGEGDDRAQAARLRFGHGAIEAGQTGGVVLLRGGACTDDGAGVAPLFVEAPEADQAHAQAGGVVERRDRGGGQRLVSSLAVGEELLEVVDVDADGAEGGAVEVEAAPLTLDEAARDGRARAGRLGERGWVIDRLVGVGGDEVETRVVAAAGDEEERDQRADDAAH
jgi:hypothetical protein